jgi:hypothetical protein
MIEEREPQPFKKKEEHEEAEKKVLFPETDVTKVRFGDYEIPLRPLTLEYQNRLVAVAKKALGAFAAVQGSGASGLDVIINAAEISFPALIDACVLIADFYKVPGADREWIATHLDDGQAMDVLMAQLEKGTSNSFLRRGVLPLLKLAQETFANVERGVIEQAAQSLISGARPESIPPSVKDGVSP